MTRKMLEIVLVFLAFAALGFFMLWGFSQDPGTGRSVFSYSTVESAIGGIFIGVAGVAAVIRPDKPNELS